VYELFQSLWRGGEHPRRRRGCRYPVSRVRAPRREGPDRRGPHGEARFLAARVCRRTGRELEATSRVASKEGLACRNARRRQVQKPGANSAPQVEQSRAPLNINTSPTRPLQDSRAR